MLGRDGLYGKGRVGWEAMGWCRGRVFLGRDGLVGKGRVCWEGTGLLRKEVFFWKGRIFW